jgi:hypothetical protein
MLPLALALTLTLTLALALALAQNIIIRNGPQMAIMQHILPMKEPVMLQLGTWICQDYWEMVIHEGGSSLLATVGIFQRERYFRPR